MRPFVNSIYKLLDVRPGERREFLLLVLYTFFMGIFLALYYTVANTLFLKSYGPGWLPYGFIAMGLGGFLVVRGFSWLQRKMDPGRSFLLATGFMLGMSLLFWLGVKGSAAAWLDKALPFVLFTFIGPIAALMALTLGGLVLKIFDLRQGKRLFGLLQAGETVAAIAAFFSVPVLSSHPSFQMLFGQVENFLLISAAGLVGAILVLLRLNQSLATPESNGKGPAAQPESSAPSTRPALFQGNLLKLMSAFLALSTLLIYFADFGFLGSTRLISESDDPRDLANLIGTFYGVLKIIELAMSFLSGKLLNQFGLQIGIALMPFLICLFTLLGIATGVLGPDNKTVLFLTLALIRLFDRVVRKTMEGPSFRVLYQLLPKSQQVRAQSFMEGVVVQGSTGLAGLILIGINAFFGPDLVWNLSRFLMIQLPIVGVWLWVSVRLYRAYKEELRVVLHRNTQLQFSSEEVSTAGLSEKRLWISEKAREDADQRQMRRQEVPEPDQATLPAQQLPDRLEHVQYLAEQPGDEALQKLLPFLQAPDPEVQAQAALALHQRGFSVRDPESFPASRNDLLALLDDRARTLTWHYATWNDLPKDDKFDFLRQAVSGAIGGKQKQLFQVLAFFADREETQAIEQMLTDPNNPAGSAFALEMLDISLPPEIVEKIAPLLREGSAVSKVKGVQNFYPQLRLDAEARLTDIAMADFIHVHPWIKTEALFLLAEGQTSDSETVLRALMFHADRDIREAASISLRKRQPEIWAGIDARRPPALQVQDTRHASLPALWERMRFFRRALPASWEQSFMFSALALSFQASSLAPGDIFLLPKESVLLVQNGLLMAPSAAETNPPLPLDTLLFSDWDLPHAPQKWLVQEAALLYHCPLSTFLQVVQTDPFLFQSLLQTLNHEIPA